MQLSDTQPEAAVRHPEMSAAQVHVEWIRLLHGDSVAAAISPDAV